MEINEIKVREKIRKLEIEYAFTKNYAKTNEDNAISYVVYNSEARQIRRLIDSLGALIDNEGEEIAGTQKF